MDIVVSIKQVTDTSEAVDVVEIDASGKDIKKEALISSGRRYTMLTLWMELEI